MATNSTPTFTVEALDGFAGSAYVGLCDGCGHRTKRKGSERIAAASIRDHVKACGALTETAEAA